MVPGVARSRHGSVDGIAVALASLGAAVLLGVVAGYVWPGNRSGAGATMGDPPRVDTSTLPATVPLQRVGGHLLVDVLLGPDGPLVPMLLDTGAPTMLSAELAARIGAEPVGRTRLVSVVGASRLVEVVRIADLTIGQARFTDVPAVVGVLTPDGPLADIAAHGIVGANLMQGAVWQIDYAAGTLAIAADTAGLDHVDQALQLDFAPASRDSPSPLIELAIDGVVRPFLLDSGSTAGLVVYSALLGPALADRPACSATFESWDGLHDSSARFAVAEVALGDVQAQRRIVVTTDALSRSTAIIGNGFLAGFILTIDWPGRKIYLEPGCGTLGCAGDRASAPSETIPRSCRPHA